jgi:CBS domain-containing protein
MPDAPSQLVEIRDQLKSGKASVMVSVRTLLSWFNAQRRGQYIVEEIRRTLSGLTLKTDPDFEYAYIDGIIRVLLDKPESKPVANASGAAAAPALIISNLPLEPSPATTDPTYRIGKLAAANNTPVSVKPDTTIAEAITLMLLRDFSQLPVMQTDVTVKGMISWQSLGARIALGTKCDKVAECMDKAVERSSEDSLFAVIPDIVENQYILVRNKENKISGIITTSDLSVQFGQLAEPFLLLSEIEQHIRRILQKRFSLEDLKQAKDPEDTERVILSANDLSFGEYIRLLEEPDRWAKLGVKIDRKIFVSQLQDIRNIRNDVMHFDPDGISDEERKTLRKFSEFLRSLQQLGAT